MSEKYHAKYKCGYCGRDFERVIGFTGGGVDSQGRKIKKVSSQVACPHCKNMLKTWDDAEDLKEIKKNEINKN
jgi:DNA-directed RNA polymerase subunit RPC12/RpoP